jgi:hypothetical protein
MANEPSKSTGGVTQEKRKSTEPKNVYLVPFPKVVFLYPTFIVAIITGIVMSMHPDGGSRPDPTNHVIAGMSLFFLVVLAANLVVLGFDFPRATWLALLFFLVAAFFALWVLFTYYPQWAPNLTAILDTIRPVANPTFYFFFAGTLGLIYLGVMITVRFNYWEVRGNEVLHHRGMLSDLVRYPTERLKVEKEINDVFEYILLGAGDLILTPRDATRPIVLENVLGISKKEKLIARLLSTIDVNISTGDVHE